MSERERYMLDALKAIVSFGKGVVLRPYMDDHKITWDDKEDVKTWMQRIAQDAIEYAEKKTTQTAAPLKEPTGRKFR
jgi:hypothetical protein